MTWTPPEDPDTPGPEAPTAAPGSEEATGEEQWVHTPDDGEEGSAEWTPEPPDTEEAE